MEYFIAQKYLHSNSLTLLDLKKYIFYALVSQVKSDHNTLYYKMVAIKLFFCLHVY